MSTSPIDLSSGLIPKSGNIDLSSGLVPKTAPPETGVMASFKRTGQGIANLPGAVANAMFLPPQTDSEQHILGAGDPNSMALLAIKRLIGDPMNAEYQKSEDLAKQAHELRQAGKHDEADQMQHMSNMHFIGSIVPVAGPMGADITQRYLSGDKSGAVTDLATAVAGPKIAEGATGLVASGAKAALPIVGKVAKSAEALGEPLPIVGPALERLQKFRDAPAKLRDIWGIKPQAAIPDIEAAAESEARAVPADTEPAATPANMPSTLPRVESGEGVLNKALTSLDNQTLLKVAKSRGINVTQEGQLKAGAANSRLIKKIIDDFSPEELDEVRNQGIEMAQNKAVPGAEAGADASAEAWRYKVLKTFFPDVKISNAMEARALATIAKRPSAAKAPAVPPEETHTLAEWNEENLMRQIMANRAKRAAAAAQ